MLKVLLINPYSTAAEPVRAYPLEPLGLIYLATYLLREVESAGLDISVSIFDAMLEGPDTTLPTASGFRSGLSDKEIENRLVETGPGIVGITNNYTNHTGDVLSLAGLVRQTVPEATIVLGGAHATIDHENLLKRPQVDVVIRGEGEETFKQTVLAVFHRSGFEDIQGITFKKGQHIQVNPDRELIPDLDTLPIPDRSLVPYLDYLKRAGEMYFHTKNKPVGTIFTSRGCPYKCVFCSTQKVWRNKWRGRSAGNIAAEIEYLMRDYGVREVAFQDDQLMGSKPRIQELCRLIIRQKMNISLVAPPGISPSLIDRKTMGLMKKAGFYRICLSIDVGTEAAKTYVRKPVRLKKMRQLVKDANATGLWTYATFVTGFPYETTEDLEETVRFAYGLKLDFVRFYIAQPHLGSELYQRFVDDGRIDEKVIQSHHSVYDAMMGTNHMQAKELKARRDKAELGYLRYHLRHFINPAYLLAEFLPKLASSADIKYFFGLLRHFRGAASQ